MSLISYVKTATNKRYSYLRVVAIRISIHPTGETWYTWHVCFPRQSTYVTHMLTAGGPCTWQPFTLTQQSWTDSLFQRKSAPNSTSQLGWVARGTHRSFSPKHNHWSSALKSNIYWWTDYMGLLGPYHLHVFSTFNTCSWGPTHRSLTDIGESNNLGGAGFHITFPDLPNWRSSTFHQRASIGLRLINPTITAELKK
jgi:hypothetical protein